LPRHRLKRNGQKSWFIPSTLLPLAWFDSSVDSKSLKICPEKVIETIHHRSLDLWIWMQLQPQDGFDIIVT
jgi:hypothetical protein